MSNQQEDKDVLDEEIVEGEPEVIGFEDKRRFDDSGERVEVKVEDAEAADPPKPAEVVRLEKQLEEMSARCHAAESKLQEVQKRFEAERGNLEKETLDMRTRMRKSLEQQADQSRFNFLVSLLPVLDNLNLAIQAAATDASFENLIGGVEGTARSFEQALITVGVSPIPSIGEKFDPKLHEAVDMIETDEENEGLIMSEYARGYTFNGRLLRPARVQVGTVARSQAG
ncbi:MAG: nucleotide exchange factor GrpE [Acidobacteriota bacterium]|nr:nucleotide exchange factor GrpE [Acidobacteriota bacterium]